MFRNYWVSAIKALSKNKLTALINIAGLAISLAACLVILLNIRKELSFDRHHPDYERVYRLIENIDSETNVEYAASMPGPVMPAVYNDYSHLIESWVRIYDAQLPIKAIMLDNNEKFNETDYYYADSNLFQIFNIPLLQGNPDEVLIQPFTMVISDRLARKYYGNEDPVGRVIRLEGDDRFSMTITGVIGQSHFSHFQPQAIISMATAKLLYPAIRRNWVWNPCWSYLKLAEGVSPEELEAQFPEFVQKYYPDRLKPMVSQALQPIGDIHLHSHREFEMKPNSDIKYIYIFFCSALFLLIIACINFINLNTISLSSRVREIGIRKVVGASRTQLIVQYLFESVLTAFIAFFIGVGLLALSFPFISSAIGLEMEFMELIRHDVMVIMGGLVIITGLLAGFYPAIILSGIDVVRVFKGGLKGSKKSIRFRKAMVVFQFSISTVLIIFTVVSQKQLKYMLTKDNGYQSENIMLMAIDHTRIRRDLEPFKARLMENPNITGLTVMNEYLGIHHNNHEFNYEGMDPTDWHYFPALIVDEDFVSTFKINLIAGRDYDKSHSREDSLSIIVNKALTRFLGFDQPEEAIGTKLRSMSGHEKIIGVVDDFNYRSLHHPVGPFVLDIENRRGAFYYFARFIAINVTEINHELLEHMGAVWGDFAAQKPFDYKLLDHSLKKQYKGESEMGTIVGIFSVLAILVACMGLFALSWFIARQKTKELAIRKTMGAHWVHLLGVATKDQLGLVLIALGIAFPLAYWIVGKWMEEFAFRVGQGIMPYLFAAIVSIIIAFVTMGYFAFKAASRDPVKALKYE